MEKVVIKLIVFFFYNFFLNEWLIIALKTPISISHIYTKQVINNFFDKRVSYNLNHLIPYTLLRTCYVKVIFLKKKKKNLGRATCHRDELNYQFFFWSKI